MNSTWAEEPNGIRCKVAHVSTVLSARAAGYWRLDRESDQLALVAFVAGEGLDSEVARAFETATREVPLVDKSLGIVAAALTAQPTVSRIRELSPDSGSGRWLWAFGADRSVAVPICTEERRVIGVLSAALTAGSKLDDDEVVEQIREEHPVSAT
jgi:hypothetical protein